MLEYLLDDENILNGIKIAKTMYNTPNSFVRKHTPKILIGIGVTAVLGGIAMMFFSPNTEQVSEMERTLAQQHQASPTGTTDGIGIPESELPATEGGLDLDLTPKS